MKRLLVASLIVGALAVPGAAQKKEFSFPHVKANGRATPEFYYQGLQVVANYDYSQRNHKGAWLLIDIAAASRQRFVLHKGDLKVITPSGREIGVAPQQTMISDAPRITELVQNARIWRRNLISYFNIRTVIEPIRFQIA